MSTRKNDRLQVQEVRDFWNSRAGLGQWAGTNDVIAKQLEIEAIASYARDGMQILDFGCGNGITAIELARRFNVRILGIDYAAKMICAAESLSEGQPFKGSIKFQVGDVESLSGLKKKFDLVYTERTLINLSDFPAQRGAIAALTNLLPRGGQYVMCENSEDGLNAINELRERVSLPRITPPWHNRYMKDNEIQTIALPGIKLEDINYYSSTYYFLSRVVNAWLEQENGKEPVYDAPVNQLALLLPSFEKMGQGRIWLWRKVS